MSTQINSLKLIAGLFRNRFNVVQELIGVYKGDTSRGHETLIKLKELFREKADIASKSELARKMRVAKGYCIVEMAPPSSPDELNKIKEEIKLVQEFMKPDMIKLLTVKQAWLIFLVGLEVGLWFFLGETLGKFHIVGYKTCVD